jgi:flagellar transcriptional activator FlhD
VSVLRIDRSFVRDLETDLNDRGIAEAVVSMARVLQMSVVAEGVSPLQIMKLASSNMLLCRFRADDDMVWNLLTQHNLPARTANESTSRLHANLLMSSRFAEASI